MSKLDSFHVSHRIALFVAPVVLATVIGCAARPQETTPIEDDTLSGTFNGKDWKFASGATAKVSPESNQILTYLGAEPGADTDCQAHGTQTLTVEVPFKPGVYALGLDQTVTFNFGSDALEATQGQIIVHEVTEEVVRAGLYAIYNDNPNYEVSGQFVARRCSYF